MKIVFRKIEYPVTIEESRLSEEIESLLPLSLTMRRFGNVEFVGDLPVKPMNDGRKVSHILADEMYYYAGWNVICLIYAEGDISPYHVNYVGKITGNLSELLKNEVDEIKVTIIE